MKRMLSQGILYIATGSKHLQEAMVNAANSRRFSNDLNITIVTDKCLEARQSQVFNKVLMHKDVTHSYRDKISALPVLPYELTLFLDSDAFISSSIDSLFHHGQYCDAAAALAPVRIPPGWCDFDVPATFPELNSGVLLLRRSKKQRRLIRQWLHLYDQMLQDHHCVWDQATFRSVLWKFITKKKFRFMTLPPEFNLRTPKPWVAGRGLPVHIVHGRFPQDELDEFVQYLNSDINRFRTFSDWLRRYPDSDIRPRFDAPLDG